MIQNLEAQIKDCMDWAAEADRWAKLGRSPAIREDALALSKACRTLAAKYERLERYIASSGSVR